LKHENFATGSDEAYTSGFDVSNAGALLRFVWDQTWRVDSHFLDCQHIHQHGLGSLYFATEPILGMVLCWRWFLHAFLSAHANPWAEVGLRICFVTKGSAGASPCYGDCQVSFG
jgi:hypothetical protein